jgi:hypothetical protein
VAVPKRFVDVIHERKREALQKKISQQELALKTTFQKLVDFDEGE